MSNGNDQKWIDFALEFKKQTGRFPSTGDYMMATEAIASIALDKASVQTMRFEEDKP